MRRTLIHGGACRGVLAVVLVGAVAVAVAVAAAAPGDLDPGFDADGRVTLDLGSTGDFASDVLVQPDGKVVLVGGGFDAASDIAVVRLSPDGSLDAAFDGDGIVDVDFGGSDYGYAVARQADGKLVVSGSGPGPNTVVVVRLNVDGSLDTSFDGDGKKAFSLGGTSGAEDVLVQPDGKIVLVSSGSALQDIAVVRLNADGSFDTTFDGDGVAFHGFGGDDLGLGVALYPDGKLVVVGTTSAPTAIVVLRLLANGSLDPTLGGDGNQDGKRTFDFTGASDNGWDLLVQPDGFIVLAGEGNNDIVVVRLRPDGVLDPTFDNDGVFGALNLGQRAFAVAQQGNGKLLLVGSAAGDALVLRLNGDGALDTSFDADGKKTLDFGTASDVLLGVAVQADGRIVAAGSSASDLEVVRVEAEASPPPASPPPPPLPPPSAPPAAGAPSGPSCNGVQATIVGTKGDDRLKGTAGPDVIVALGGRDVIDAKAGDDVVCAGGGADAVRGGNGADVVLGQAGADDLRGGADADQLLGGAGVDVLRGGAGEDSCVGGKGADSGLGCEEEDL